MVADDKVGRPSSSDSTTISIADLINSSSITSSKLSGSKNYLPWCAAIKKFLTSKERLKYIEEDKPEATTSVWEKEDDQVRSCVWNSMELYVSCDVMLLPIAYRVWISVRRLMALKGMSKGYMSSVRIYFSLNRAVVFTSITIL